MTMAEHNELGKQGEQVAVDYLLEKGYEILERNYQARKAEIDIIAKKDNWLIVVEVKTRTSIDFGNPEDFVNKNKIKSNSSGGSRGQSGCNRRRKRKHWYKSSSSRRSSRR